MDSDQSALFRLDVRKYSMLFLAAFILLGLALIGWFNYLLFHTLAELFSIVTAFTIFVLTWNGRRFFNNGAFLLLGISFLFVGSIDLLHTLAFRGMNIFSNPGADLPTQLWLCARYIQAIALVSAPFFIHRRLPAYTALAGFAILTALMLTLVFTGVFPPSLVESGLTNFKIASEYAIILLFAIGMVRFIRARQFFDADVLRLLMVSVAFNILAEFFFTQYLDPYDIRNLLGHFFKIVSFYLVYRAIIVTGFLRPQDLLYRDLTQSEQALRASEARERARAKQLEAIMEAVPAVVWITQDAKAEKVTGNQASTEFLRMKPNTNQSKSAPAGEAPSHFRVFQGERELSPEAMPLQITAATGIPVRDFEETVVFDDGEERHLLGNVAPLINEAGDPEGAVAVFIDITRRVSVEHALQESEQRYRGLFETMAEGFVLVELDRDEQGTPVDYRYLEVNPAFERMTGVSRELVLGKASRELTSEYSSVWFDRFVEVIRTGKSAHFEEFNSWIGKYFEVMINPISKNQCAALIVDVTERRLNQEALRRSEARLRRLVNSNIIGVIYADEKGEISLANDAFLYILGYTQEDLARKLVNWRELTTPEYKHLDEAGVAEAKRRGACTPYEKEYLRKDGSRVPVLLGYAYFEEDEPPFVCFLIDLTEQKKAEAAAKEYASQLERSNRELQDFAFVASHDLQEPLRKIQAFGDRLETRMKDNLDEETRDYLDRMRNASVRMRNMINDLLTLSRITTRGNPFERVSLTSVVQDVVSDLEVRIEASQGRVEVASLPVIEADPTQMRQLFQNLIGNALKFHNPDVPPVVQVQAECIEEGREIQILVADNGIGFDEQYLDRIFQPFQRLYGVGQYEGSGIGLAICRKIVERHSGTITGRSSPGSGSTFIVRLPVKQTNRSD